MAPRQVLPAFAILSFLVVVSGADPLDDAVRREMAAHDIPGLSLAVVRDGAIVSSRAYGWTGIDGRAVTPDTIFQAGSVSKPVSALAALQLAAQGRLSLDADVNDAGLRSWRVPSNRFTQEQPVTLRLLLCHSAGLTVHGFAGYGPQDQVPSLLQVLDGLPPANSLPVRVSLVPGTRWRYSGGGYEVMQQLVSDVTSQPFAEFLEQTVLLPLGMARSTFRRPLPPALREDAARGHELDGREVDGGWHVYPEEAAAGLWTTAGDLAKFILAIQAGKKGQGPVPRQIADWMTTPARGSDALGFFVAGPEHGVFLHDGRNDGYDTLLYGSRNLGVTVMINRNDDSGALGRIRQAAWDLYRRD